MASLGIEFPREQARVREILGHYRAIGPAGQFGVLMLEDLLRRADAAWAAQDVVAMVTAYAEMRAVEA